MRVHEHRDLLKKRIAAAQDLILNRRNYLAGPKFQGFDSDGYPADYIYTHEVNAMLREIEDLILGIHDEEL